MAATILSSLLIQIKFAEKNQQRLYIGDLQAFVPYILLHNQSSPVLAPRIDYNPSRKTVTRMRPSYPPNTKAFLY